MHTQSSESLEHCLESVYVISRTDQMLRCSDDPHTVDIFVSNKNLKFSL